jgi:hypothetical protein
MLFDQRLLFTLDCLREQFGLAIVNNWMNGGVWEYRGWRPPEYKLCAPLSQHYFGRAVDMNFREHSASSVRNWLQVNYKTELESKRYIIRRIERDTSWLHIDVGNSVSADIEYFNP